MRTPPRIRFAAAAGLAAVVFLPTACKVLDTAPRQSERSSSLVEFLYPKASEPLITPSIPPLHRPLHLGLAFAPRVNRAGLTDDFSDAQKSLLLQRVAAEFEAQDFVGSITVIAADRLRPGGGFANLDQARTDTGKGRFDGIVLIGYDQMQFTDPNKLSLTYWTVVGTYLFNGNWNDTHTLIEAVVYDLPSRSLLFRAPGSSQLRASAPPALTPDQLRKNSAASFDRAVDDLIANLRTELKGFRDALPKENAG